MLYLHLLNLYSIPINEYVNLHDLQLYTFYNESLETVYNLNS